MHPATGSTLTEVTEGCTATFTGPLVMPWAVAVMTAVPDAVAPLQTTKVESQTPPQTRPAGEIVATAVLEELKVKVVLTAVLAEFCAAAVTWTTSPETKESVAGVTTTWATVLLTEGLPPPQPARNAAKTRINANFMNEHCM